MNAQPVKIIAAENCHFYYKDGRPCYEVAYSDPRKGMRPCTLSDARKLNLRRSVTRIINCAAKPGLENWKLNQTLHAALTLPPIDGETLDQYAARVIADSEAQSLKARERGTSLHEAIEHYILGQPFERVWNDHILAIEHAMQQYGLDLLPANAEKTFATKRYGGKIDWFIPVAMADIKTKDKIDNGKKLGFDNHLMQLVAYRNGIKEFLGIEVPRLLNIFVGTEDKKVVIHEWPKEDFARGWGMFEALLTYCELSENYRSI